MSSDIIHSLYIAEEIIIEDCHQILKRPNQKIEVSNNMYDSVIEKLKSKYSEKILKEKFIRGKFNRDQVINITNLEKISVFHYDEMVKGVVFISETSLSAVLLFCCLMWNEEFVNGLEQSFVKTENLNKGMKRIKLKKMLTVDKSKLGASGAAFVVPKAISFFSGTSSSSIFVAPIAGGILSSVDVYRYCSGTISKDQLMKNVVVIGAGLGSGVAGGLVGGAIGGTVGSVLLPGIGTAAGGVLGGLVGGGITNLAASYVTKKAVLGHVKDDSDKLMIVFQKTMMETIALFIMTPQETSKFATTTRKEIGVKSFLREMYQSTNRGKNPEKAKMLAFEKFMKVAREILIEERMEILLGEDELGMIAEAQEELLELASTAATSTNLYQNNFDSPHELGTSEEVRNKVVVSKELEELYFSSEQKVDKSDTNGTGEEEEEEGEGEVAEEDLAFLRDLEEGGLAPWEYFNYFSEEEGCPELILSHIIDEKTTKKKSQMVDSSMFPTSKSSSSSSSSRPFLLHSKTLKAQVIKNPDLLPTEYLSSTKKNEEQKFETLDLEKKFPPPPPKKNFVGPRKRKKVAPPPPPRSSEIRRKEARERIEKAKRRKKEMSIEIIPIPPPKKFVMESVKVNKSNIVDVHPSVLPTGVFNQLTMVSGPPLDMAGYGQGHHMKVKPSRNPPKDLRPSDPHPNYLVPFDIMDPIVVLDCVNVSDNVLNESKEDVVDILQYLLRHRKKKELGSTQLQQKQQQQTKPQPKPKETPSLSIASALSIFSRAIPRQRDGAGRTRSLPPSRIVRNKDPTSSKLIKKTPPPPPKFLLNRKK